MFFLSSLAASTDSLRNAKATFSAMFRTCVLRRCAGAKGAGWMLTRPDALKTLAVRVRIAITAFRCMEGSIYTRPGKGAAMHGHACQPFRQSVSQQKHGHQPGWRAREQSMHPAANVHQASPPIVGEEQRSRLSGTMDTLRRGDTTMPARWDFRTPVCHRVCQREGS